MWIWYKVNTIGEIALIPGQNAIFEMKVNDEVIWDRKVLLYSFKLGMLT